MTPPPSWCGSGSGPGPQCRGPTGWKNHDPAGRHHRRRTMDAAANPGKAVRSERAIAPAPEATTAASKPVSDHRFGPDAAGILVTEHCSLLGTRSLLWTQAMSRTTVFLGVVLAAQ